MKKSIIVLFLSTILILSGCDVFNKDKVFSSQELYSAYSEATEKNGDTPLSYEDWLLSLKGEKGDSGENGEDGEQGEQGVGISKIELVLKSDNVDTYKITFTNGESFIYTITNGLDGNKGDDGLSAYELYKKYHPEYIKSESEFVEDLLISTPIENKNPEGLDFYLKDDGTFAVGIGKACLLKKIIIPSTYQDKAVTEIIDSGFSSKNGINLAYTEIVLPNSITKIGKNAFNGAKNLETINMPDNLIEIDDCAFLGCSSLTQMTFNNNLKKIGARAFENCTALISISLPENFESFGRWAFFNCKNLTSITYGGTIPQWTYNVEKENCWDNYTGNYTVTCSNGTVTK